MHLIETPLLFTVVGNSIAGEKRSISPALELRWLIWLQMRIVLLIAKGQHRVSLWLCALIIRLLHQKVEWHLGSREQRLCHLDQVWRDRAKSPKFRLKVHLGGGRPRFGQDLGQKCGGGLFGLGYCHWSRILHRWHPNARKLADSDLYLRVCRSNGAVRDLELGCFCQSNGKQGWTNFL